MGSRVRRARHLADDRACLAVDAFVLRPLSRLPSDARASRPNTTASSWSGSWCCAAAAWPRRQGTRGPAIATSSAGGALAVLGAAARERPLIDAQSNFFLVAVVRACCEAAFLYGRDAVVRVRAGDAARACALAHAASRRSFSTTQRARSCSSASASCREYYPTRTELRILERMRRRRSPHRSGPNAEIVEFGAGSLTKVRLLLDALQAAQRYRPHRYLR